jgi:hypothetical protein
MKDEDTVGKRPGTVIARRRHLRADPMTLLPELDITIEYTTVQRLDFQNQRNHLDLLLNLHRRTRLCLENSIRAIVYLA